MRGYNPYGVKLSALALFFAPLLNEGVFLFLKILLLYRSYKEKPQTLVKQEPTAFDILFHA